MSYFVCFSTVLLVSVLFTDIHSNNRALLHEYFINNIIMFDFDYIF